MMINQTTPCIADPYSRANQATRQVDILRCPRRSRTEPLIEAADAIENIAPDKKVGAVQRVNRFNVLIVVELRYGSITLHQALNFRIVSFRGRQADATLSGLVFRVPGKFFKRLEPAMIDNDVVIQKREDIACGETDRLVE